MRVEIKPKLLLLAKQVLFAHLEDGISRIADRLAALLTESYDLTPSQAGALRRYLVFNWELDVSKELTKNGAICARIGPKIGPMPAWPQELEDKFNMVDLHREVEEFRADPEMYIALIEPGRFYLDWHDPEKPKAATFAEALIKADDCRAHARAIERAAVGAAIEDLMRYHLNKIREHTIVGPVEKVFEHLREAMALLPLEVNAWDIARTVLPTDCGASEEQFVVKLKEELMKR